MRNFALQVGDSKFKWPKKFPLINKLPGILTWQAEPSRGLDEAFVKSGILDVNYANCVVCHAVAREPVEMPCCEGWFCSLCFLILAEKNPPTVSYEPVARFGFKPDPVPLANPVAHFSKKCTRCTQNFCYFEVRNYHQIKKDRRAKYQQLMVECPNQCGLIGHPNQIVEHQTFYCKKRKVRCPNFQCVEAPKKIKKIREHFATCKLKRFHCKTCGWAVPEAEKDGHKCLKKLSDIITKLQSQDGFEEFRTMRALRLCCKSKPYANTTVNNIFLKADTEFRELQSASIQEVTRVLFARMNEHLPPDTGPWLSSGWPAEQWP